MDFDFLVRDINEKLSQKAIGTDKGLAKIGDGIVNLTYSVAKSIYLTKTSSNKTIYRTGIKVSKKVLAEALKNANMKSYAKSRADSHDLADTVEALIAYIWISNKMSIKEITEFLYNNFSGNLNLRVEEITSATKAFTNLLDYSKKFLPKY